MKLARIVVGEMLLLGASILIFRSVWTLLDQYFGYSNLWLMLIIARGAIDHNPLVGVKHSISAYHPQQY